MYIFTTFEFFSFSWGEGGGGSGSVKKKLIRIKYNFSFLNKIYSFIYAPILVDFGYQILNAECPVTTEHGGVQKII